MIFLDCAEATIHADDVGRIFLFSAGSDRGDFETGRLPITMSLVHAPEFRTVGLDDEVQLIGASKLIGVVLGFGFGAADGFGWMSPDSIWRFSLKKSCKTSCLLNLPERRREGLWSEEHSYRASKQLIYPANWQWEIDETINSTNTKSGKGRMSPDSGKFALLDCGLVIATRRAKGMVIVVAKQFVFLEKLLETISRKRHLT